MKLVIVESPTKAKTIKKFLPKEYVVESSYGHIRDLPRSATEIPAKVKGEKWARIGVNVDEQFDALYIVPKDKKKQVTKLKSLLKDADELFLATDEDREGEAISWHLLEVLKPKVPVKRMVFHEITKSAIEKALAEPRELDMNLVHAQETRRILDRLYGYEVSPILWRKVAPKLSAGRVQSAALQLIVEREKERMAFVAGGYWNIVGTFSIQGTPFEAKLTALNDKRIAGSKDFDAETGKLKKSLADTVQVLDAAMAEQYVTQWQDDAFASWNIQSVDKKPVTVKPKAPFITSTLQQEAGGKLGWPARKTMQVAQKLYEKGFITYMRTDSFQLSEQAVAAARERIAEQFGKEYVPDAPRTYKNKSKNAQEAHEAIRPSGDAMQPVSEIAGSLDTEEQKLYDFIWKRTVASQMTDAQLQQTTIKLTDVKEEAVFTAGGRVVEFPGFLAAYTFDKVHDNTNESDKAEETVIPDVAVGDTTQREQITSTEHTTKPRARYSEAALVKELEALGIGRPSTYASIIDTIQRRGYVFKEGSALIPRFVAFGVVALLWNNFHNLVNTDYTAAMEEDLDDIAVGKKDAVPYLAHFYFGEGKDEDNPDYAGLKNMLDVEIDARATCTIPIGKNASGQQINVRVGRYGPFVERVLNAETDDVETASIPDDLPPDQLTVEMAEDFIEKQAQGPQSLGIDPETNLPVFALEGRYGPYVQLGEKPAPKKKLTLEEKEAEKLELAELRKQAKAEGKTYKKPKPFKPKMKGLLAGMKLEDVTLESALQLLSFPKELGIYEKTGEPIVADLGRFGPYIKCGEETRSLSAEDNLLELTLERATLMLDTPKVRGRRATVLREIGNFPDDDLPIKLYNGRYGHYLKYKDINVGVPDTYDPKELTLEEATQLIKDKQAKM